MLNPQFVLQSSLEELFIDKLSGLPLAGGQIFFFADNNRTMKKSVFELSGAPPNYTYTPLPNPLTLSSIGTPSDQNGNTNVVIYYYPYDDFGNLQTYYVAVYDSLGNLQFTRENWPYPNIEGGNGGGGGGGGGGNIGASGYTNLLSNSQFVDVNFNPNIPGGLIIPTIAGTVTVEIAPDWNLAITATGVSNVTVQRAALAGNSGYQSNPPYELVITPGANVTLLKLYQTLSNNPDIWSMNDNVTPGNGWLAATLGLDNMSSAMMAYEPTIGAATTLINATNGSGYFQNFSSTTQIPLGANTSTPPGGYVNISIYPSLAAPTKISNVQVVGLESNIPNIAYQQQPVNRQHDLLFNYYQPKLNYRPVPSYLVGWDFPKNPAQLGATFGTAAITNASRYTWDQTLLYQTALSSASVSRGTSGEYVITAAATTQVAIVQYLDAIEAQEILSGNVSVNVSGLTNQAGGITGTVSLWVTDATALPAAGSNLSIVATLDANGYVASKNPGTGATVGWTEITRNGLGNAQFTLPVAKSSGASKYNDIGISYFGLNNAGAITSMTPPTFFAIVVGFASLTSGNTITIDSISLVPGDIPCRPAPKTLGAVLQDCQRYYWSTFLPGTVPAQNVGVNTGEFTYIAGMAGANPEFGSVIFPVIMRKTPTMTYYNPAAANALLRDETSSLDGGAMTTVNISQKQTQFWGNGNGVTIVGYVMGIHLTADARLGIV